MAEEESIVDAVCKRIAFDKEQIERNEFQRIELDSFNLSEFWDQFGSAVQALSNQVTKIGFLCGKEPYPNNADLSSMLQDMMQYYTMMRDLYLVLPEKVGALVFKAVTSATLNIMAALETIVASFADLSEKGASERLPLTGMFWDACNAVESLPRDNLQATLKVIEEERALAADAEEELNTVPTYIDDEKTNECRRKTGTEKVSIEGSNSDQRFEYPPRNNSVVLSVADGNDNSGIRVDTEIEKGNVIETVATLTRYAPDVRRKCVGDSKTDVQSTDVQIPVQGIYGRDNKKTSMIEAGVRKTYKTSNKFIHSGIEIISNVNSKYQPKNAIVSSKRFPDAEGRKRRSFLKQLDNESLKLYDSNDSKQKMEIMVLNVLKEFFDKCPTFYVKDVLQHIKLFNPHIETTKWRVYGHWVGEAQQIHILLIIDQESLNVINTQGDTISLSEDYKAGIKKFYTEYEKRNILSSSINALANNIGKPVAQIASKICPDSTAPSTFTQSERNIQLIPQTVVTSHPTEASECANLFNMPFEAKSYKSKIAHLRKTNYLKTQVSKNRTKELKSLKKEENSYENLIYPSTGQSYKSKIAHLKKTNYLKTYDNKYGTKDLKLLKEEHSKNDYDHKYYHPETDTVNEMGPPVPYTDRCAHEKNSMFLLRKLTN